VTINADNIVIETQRIEIRGLDIGISGNSKVDVSAAATLAVKSGGKLDVKGGLLCLNGDSQPVARAGDQVLGGVIATGSPTVLAWQPGGASVHHSVRSPSLARSMNSSI